MAASKKVVVVEWYARCWGVERMGPFDSQVEAWENVMTVDGDPAPLATVWCEKAKDEDDR